MTKKPKIPAAALEFQSDALELEQRPAPWYSRLTLYVILLLFVLAVVWASVFKVDKIVMAEGKLTTLRPNIVMKPLERTVIREINVVAGQFVHENDVLITFDPTFNQAEEERLQEQLKSLTMETERLKAEAAGREFQVDGAAADWDYKQQRLIFDERNLYYRARLDYFEQNLQRIDAGLHTRRQSLSKQRERLEKLQEIEDMLTTLHEQGSVSLKQLLETQLSRLQMEGEVDRLENQLQEAEHERSSVGSERDSFIKDYQRQTVESLVEVERNRQAAEKQLEKARRLSSLVVLRAPCDAIVHEIAAFSEGSAVREAESLITLVPVSDVEVEANIDPRDIGLVKCGDEARIKLDPFPFQRFGTLTGRVRLISEDTFQEQLGNGATRTYYRARLTVEGRVSQVPENFRLQPGMRLTAEIKVGERRLIEYLIHPLIKALDESVREP